MFVPELIKVYPEAKVIIVKRDVDEWWPSFKMELLDTLWHPRAWLINWVVDNVIRSRAPFAMMKMHCGFFGVRDRAGIDAVAKERYEEYYESVLKEVPANQRLVYEIGSGWEPLCKFLVKPVPDTPFPRVNDRAEHDQKAKEKAQMVMRAFCSVLIPVLIGGLAVGVGLYAYWA